MSDQSDSQNKSEEQVNLSEGTSPSSSYDEGSKSTPSNLPKAATRQRRKMNSESEDEDYVAAEEEVSSKKKVVKKEFRTAASTRPDMHKKAPAKKVPMSKARVSTLETSKSTGGEAAGEGKNKKEIKRGRWCKKVDPMAEFEKHTSDEDEEEEDAGPAPKSQKLMGDPIKIVWMSEGTSYQYVVDEWAKMINAPAEQEDDVDVYAKKKKDHNSMANMYKEIPDKALETHKMGSLFDVPQKFKVMSLIVETIKRTTADQKRSFVMNEEDPTSIEAQEKREKAKAEKAAKMPSAEEASQVFLKKKQDQLEYLIQDTLRIEKGLATLTQNQESLERIIETKFYDLDLKVTEMRTVVEQLQEEAEERKG
nr:transcriptional regulator ATRX homolog [Aegilops tauschii subsp. strangulata]